MDTQGIFDRVAPYYDKMNDILSLGFHHRWKRTLVESLPWGQYKDQVPVVLDCACGTGDLGQLILSKAQSLEQRICVMGLDPSPCMLAQARMKLQDAGQVCWIEACAEHIPLPEEAVDIYLIGFGLRNVENRKQALQEALRVVKPGGTFFCLEFTPEVHPGVNWAYQPYRRYGLPFLGRLFAKDPESYEYLAQSIAAFPSPVLLSMELSQAGWSDIDYKTLDLGIAAIHTGTKQHENTGSTET